jgi:hypothetical protein
MWEIDLTTAHKNDLRRMERTLNHRREYAELSTLDRLERRIAVARARVARLTTKPGASPA